MFNLLYSLHEFFIKLLILSYFFIVLSFVSIILYKYIFFYGRGGERGVKIQASSAFPFPLME